MAYTFLDDITLPRDPQTDLQAAPRQYIDNHPWTFSGGVTLLTAASDLNAVTATGFYNVQNPVNGPGTGWWIVEILRYSTDASLVIQRATSLDGASVYPKMRKYQSAAWSAWAEAVGPTGPQGPSGQSAGRIFYYAYTDASDIATYKTMLSSPSAGSEQIITTTCSGTSDFLVAAFATDPGIPGAVDYPAGTAFRRIYGRVDSGTARYHLQIYVRNQAGTETLVRDEFSENFINTIVELQEWTTSAPDAGTMLATDRIVNKIYAQRVAGGGSLNVYTYFEGSTHVSHIQTTISAGAQGPVGPQGPQGDPGPSGPAGPPGVSNAHYTGIWRWTTKTTDANTAGQVGNNVVSGWTATVLNINQQKDDNADVTSYLADVKVGDVFRIQQKTDSTRWVTYEVTGAGTDNGTWWQYPVTTLEYGGATPNNTTEVAVTLAVTSGDTLDRDTADARYVNTSGDTMAGDLTIAKTDPRLILDSASLSERYVRIRTDGQDRWTLGAVPSAEGGGNAGSDFTIARWADNGAWIDNPIHIVRGNGDVKFKNAVVAEGAFVGKTIELVNPGASLVIKSPGRPSWMIFNDNNFNKLMLVPSSTVDGTDWNWNKGTNFHADGNVEFSDGGATFWGSVDMLDRYIYNLHDPNNPQDAATKQYVDSRTPKITVGTTAPSSPAIGDLWVDTNP